MATDVFGNTGYADVAYNVIYDFSGFARPVSNPPETNSAKAGQTVPLKWWIGDVNGDPVTDLSDITVTVEGLACSLGTTSDLPVETINGGLVNLGGGYYQASWKTPKTYAHSCKTMQLDLGEGPGMERTALFEFAK